MIVEEFNQEIRNKLSNQRKIIQEMLEAEEIKRTRAETFTDREMAHTMISNLTSQLKNIDTAIDRLEKGEYDRCKSCGNQISSERLSFLPYTTLCKVCAAEPGTDPG